MRFHFKNEELNNLRIEILLKFCIKTIPIRLWQETYIDLDNVRQYLSIPLKNLSNNFKY